MEKYPSTVLTKENIPCPEVPKTLEWSRNKGKNNNQDLINIIGIFNTFYMNHNPRMPLAIGNNVKSCIFDIQPNTVSTKEQSY